MSMVEILKLQYKLLEPHLWPSPTFIEWWSLKGTSTCLKNLCFWPYLEKASLKTQLRIWKWDHPELYRGSKSSNNVLPRERRKNPGMKETVMCTQRWRLEWCSHKPRTPGATKWDKEGFSVTDFREREWDLLTPWFQTSVLQNCVIMHISYFKPLNLR